MRCAGVGVVLLVEVVVTISKSKTATGIVDSVYPDCGFSLEDRFDVLHSGKAGNVLRDGGHASIRFDAAWSWAQFIFKLGLQRGMSRGGAILLAAHSREARGDCWGGGHALKGWNDSTAASRQYARPRRTAYDQGSRTTSPCRKRSSIPSTHVPRPSNHHGPPASAQPAGSRLLCSCHAAIPT